MTATIGCACGTVRVSVEQAPLIVAQCYCSSCREAGARMIRGGSGRSMMTPDGGTPFVLYRKDRMRFLSGMDKLRAFRLTPQSPTRRVVATCCNMPVFLEFESGHWLSFYSGLWTEAERPEPTLRTMTSDLPDASVLVGGPPSGRMHTLGFYARLLGAWIAMGFKVPKLDFIAEDRPAPNLLPTADQ